MNIKPVLIELDEKHSTNVKSSSAALIGDRYVLTTCHILSDLLNENIHLLQQLDEDKFHRYSRRPVHFHVFWRSEISLSQVFEVGHAKLFGLFKSRQLNQFYKNNFKDWSANPDTGKVRESNVNISEAIISTFLILALDGNGAVSEMNMKLVISEYMLASAMPSRICKLDEVYSVSSPFGCKEFFNSVSAGIISTKLKDPSLFLSDCSSAPGCEGGLIYTKAQIYEFPIGIIISSFNWWRKDWVGFTLIADIQMLLATLLDFKISPAINRQFGISTFLEGIQKSLVQIKCGPNWGTGILISKEKQIFITNAHVVFSNCKIILLWKDKQSTAHLLYRTSAKSALDLAILEGNINRIDLEPSLISLNTPLTGESVYCAGFPLLSNITSPLGVSITQGNISSCNPYMIQTTCRVFPGFSGGGLFNAQGALIGIIVCNTKLQDTEVYSRFSVSIPLGAFYNIIEEYLKYEDLSVLLQLENSAQSTPWRKLLGACL